MAQVRQREFTGNGDKWFVAVATRNKVSYDTTRSLVIEMPRDYDPLEDSLLSENPFPKMRAVFCRAYLDIVYIDFDGAFNRADNMRVISYQKL